MEQNACLKYFLTKCGEWCKKECAKRRFWGVDELRERVVEEWAWLD